MKYEKVLTELGWMGVGYWNIEPIFEGDGEVSLTVSLSRRFPASILQNSENSEKLSLGCLTWWRGCRAKVSFRSQHYGFLRFPRLEAACVIDHDTPPTIQI